MIITDSIGAPRKEREVIMFQDTWPWKIYDHMQSQNGYYNFIQTTKALDSGELIRLVKMNLDLYDKEFVFLQVGIVDCARRVFSTRTKQLINFLPLIRHLFRFIAKKYHFQLTRLYKITYTSPSEFRSNIDFFLTTFNESKKVILIPIVPAGSIQQKKSYKIQEQIETYNQIMKEAATKYTNTIYAEDCYNQFLPVDDNNYTSDGYHINKKGHQLVAESIIKFLTNSDLNP